MCITERRKGLVHISLFDRGWPSGLRRSPTAFEGHGCRRSVTPSDRFMSPLGDRSNALAGTSATISRAKAVQRAGQRMLSKVWIGNTFPSNAPRRDYPILPKPGGVVA